MSEPKTSVRARVQLLIEFDVPDNWGGDCALSQVRKQAIDSARTVLMRGVVIDGLALHSTGRLPNGGQQLVQADIVGEPKITAVLVESR